MKEKKFTSATDAELWKNFRSCEYNGTPLNQALRSFLGEEKPNDCCTALRMLKDRGMEYLCYFHGGRKFEVAKMIYCPECGRKL